MPCRERRSSNGLRGGTAGGPDRHRRSARWFARNRLGGHGNLYHRHVSSVLSREWSRRTDLFTDTVAASAEASVFDAAIDKGPEIADYIRPTAAQSDYLDTVSRGSSAQTAQLGSKLIERREGPHQGHSGRHDRQ